MSPMLLVILDGFGYSPEKNYNAIYQAQPAFLQYLLATYPNTLLKAAGTAVGLLPGMMGNSEVGHLTIGSGRITTQPVTFFDALVSNDTLKDHPILNQALEQAKHIGGKLHILGLVSDAGVHGYFKFFHATIKQALQMGIENIVIHPFLDGRDTAPQSAANYLYQLETLLADNKQARIGSIHGRWYAMDRDNHQERTSASFFTLTKPAATPPTSWRSLLETYYSQGITDEFIPPTHINLDSAISQGDAILFLNIRPDRARQLTRMLIENGPETTFFITATYYGAGCPTTVLYDRPAITPTFFDVVEAAGKTLFSIAESEKYAHITYFFNGGREVIREHEERVLIPSLNHATFKDYPAMSAQKITDCVRESLKNNPRDFYLINYANADMVGHSGDFDATVKAIQCLDEQLKQLYTLAVQERKGNLYITADHGNAEEKWDARSNQPRTSHTTNPVYFIAATQQQCSLEQLEGLSDIAPFLLAQMGLAIPPSME